MHKIQYPLCKFRAQCTKVVDGDTVDLFVDTGFRTFRQDRFRLLGVDAPELNDKDPSKRAAAQDAKNYLIRLLDPKPISDRWDVLVTTEKSDSFGRWLATIYILDSEGNEKNVCEELITLGLAERYTR